MSLAAGARRRTPARSRSGARQVGFFSVAAAFALLIAGCTTPLAGHGSVTTPPTTATPSASVAPTVALADCSKQFNIGAAGIPAARLKHLTIKCGKVPVPLNYDNPTGPKIEIEVLRMHDDQAPSKLPTLLMNPGGPGGSGLALPIELAPVISDDVLTHYDLVGFDPRGIGLSNSLQCVTTAEQDKINALDPNVLTPTGFATAKQAADEAATACTTKYGPALADYNTTFTAMDMDRIRIAMGDSQLNYLGFSYGTQLGYVYSHLYPKTVGVEVLDGAVDPTTDYLTSFGDQLGGFEQAFDQFAADCATKTACKSITNPRAEVESLVAQANATPMKTTKAGDSRTATGGILLTGVAEALYDQTLWPSLATGIQEAEQGDAKGLFALADEYNSEYNHDLYNAVSCNDIPPGPTDATITAKATQWSTQYPLFGLWGAVSLFACQDWQPVRHPLPPATATGSNPILVLGNIHDPATPYAGAQHLAAALTTGTLLTWNGQGHTSYLRGSQCIDDAVDAYLVDHTLPAVGTVCQE
jgi:pimeloyl-ACP methyl ester carboxylesterase